MVAVVSILFLTNFLTLNPERLVLNNKIPFGYNAGSGASGSKKSLDSNSAIVPVGATVAVPPEVPNLASANRTPFSVV